MKTQSALDAVRIRNQRMFLGNPLRSLTPESLSSQLDQFEAGDLRSAAQTWAPVPTPGQTHATEAPGVQGVGAGALEHATTRARSRATR
jgi:hypothetical protein